MKRFPHAIKANHRTETPQRMVFFDIESRVPDIEKEQFIDQALQDGGFKIEHDPYLCCSCFSDRGREKWYDDYGPNWQDNFWTRVNSFCPASSKVWIYAHNAKYDVLASGGVKYLVEYGWTVTAFSDGNPFFLRMTRRESKEDYIFRLKEKLTYTPNVDKRNKILMEIADIKSDEKKPPTTGTILILSSTNYYNTSLAELGKTFDLPKLDAAYNAPLEDAITYCRRDVEILKTAMESFYDFIIEKDLGTAGMTIASQAMNAYRHRFMPHEILIHTNLAATILERDAYSGGRTEAWYIGNIPEKVFCYDVNSMYPYVMLENDYPVNLKTYRNCRVTVADLSRFISRGYLVIARVKIYTDEPVFMVKAEKLIFPVGVFWTALCTPELIYALDHDLIIEVAEMAVYEKANIFTDYVTFFYNERLKAKAADNEVLSYLYKIFLNSLYGKFGQTQPGWVRIGDADPAEVKTVHVYNTETESYEYFKIFGGSVFKSVAPPVGENEAANAFCAIAAHVTAYARMLLWQYIQVAGPENLYYMDTDSLFVNQAAGDMLAGAGHVDASRLGALKMEKAGQMTVHGLKDYSFKGKDDKGKDIDITKIKGVNKRAIPITDVKKAADDEMRQAIAEGRVFATDTWIGMSKAIENGELSGYYQKSMVKVLKRNYDKGYRTAEGQVLPLAFNDGELIENRQAVNWQALAKLYNGIDEAAAMRELETMQNIFERDLVKSFRAAVRDLGGVNDTDYESIPRWAKNKKRGKGLDQLVSELAGYGFIFADANELYDRLWRD